jgi:ATP-binding cassette subfamily B protein
MKRGSSLNSSGGGRRMKAMGRPVDKPVNIWATVTRLLSYWKEYKGMLILILVFSLLEVVCNLLGPYLIGKAIDDCINGSIVDFSRLGLMLGILITVYVSGAFFGWSQEYAMIIISQKIIRKLRIQMIDKLHTLSLRYYDTHSRGEIMSNFTNDVELVKDALGGTVIQLITSLFMLTGIIIVMLLLSPVLMLVSCVSIPLVILLSRFVMKQTRRYFAAQQETLGKLNGLIEENISGIKVVKSFAQEENQIEKFSVLNREMQQQGTRAQIFSGILMPLMRVLDNFSYILVAVVGGFLAFGGYITVGVIQSFLLYTRQFLRPINEMATQFNAVQSAIAGAERIFRLLDEKPEVVDKVDAEEIKNVKGEVVFENVSFGYDKDKLVLKNISFTAKPDEVIAIVGSTGAGKTTIMNLLTRFYDINSGTIRIDGKDIRDISQTSLRRSLGIVLQDPFLFSESVRYNIAYGDPDSTKGEVRAASIAANARNFIIRLSDRFRTVLHEQGSAISHGQRQLITIARAILIDAPILVFDEATSNIDTRTEILIQDAIANLTKGRTCFIIAHRLSTVKNADRILVLENGEIVECGSHAELLEKKGAYYNIYNSQFAV